jgi:hypothetical protein
VTRRTSLLRSILLLGLVSCGYRPLYGGSSGEDRFCVVSLSPLVADLAVVTQVEAGLRAGLAERGGLRGGGGYPRVVVEVLRIDAASAGIAAVPGGTRGTVVGGLPLATGGPPSPLARGTRIGVLARAWVERTPEGAHERDTGDQRAVETMTAEPDAKLESLRLDDASRAAARRLGRRLARKVLGEPDAPDDGI